jgi:hypothetical protein
MGGAAENGGFQCGMIGDMERESFGDRGLHCLADCGLAMRYLVRLFGLDLDDDDDDDHRESDSGKVVKVRRRAVRKRIWKRITDKQEDTGHEIEGEAEYREKSGGFAKMLVIKLHRCYFGRSRRGSPSNL